MAKNLLGFTKKQQRRFNISLIIGYVSLFVLGWIILSSLDPIILGESLWGKLGFVGKLSIYLIGGFIFGGFIDLIRRIK